MKFFENFNWLTFYKKKELRCCGQHDVIQFDTKCDVSVSTDVSGYHLSIEDTKKVSKWNSKHTKNCEFADNGSPHNPTGAIGGRLTYRFTPTGLGNIITVACACGSILDLTDTDNW